MPTSRKCLSFIDMSQGQACQWIHILSEVLLLALTELGHTLERDPQKVKELLESYMDESHGCPADETGPGTELETEKETWPLMAQSVAGNVPGIMKSKSDSTVVRRRPTQ